MQIRVLDIPYTVIHACGVKGSAPADFLRDNIEFYKLFADDAEKFGVDLLIKNSAEAWNPAYFLRHG